MRKADATCADGFHDLGAGDAIAELRAVLSTTSRVQGHNLSAQGVFPWGGRRGHIPEAAVTETFPVLLHGHTRATLRGKDVRRRFSGEKFLRGEKIL